MVAQLHNFSAAWQPPNSFERFTWDWDSQLGGSLFEQLHQELVESMPIKYREPDEEIQAGLRYKIHCIEKDIPYQGFFDPVFSPERPFEL